VAHVVIYTRGLCWFCRRARKLLKRKGVAFEEFDVWKEPERFGEMIERSGGGMTVPQIFIDDLHVGGSDELIELDRAGRLDALLAVEAPD